MSNIKANPFENRIILKHKNAPAGIQNIYT